MIATWIRNFTYKLLFDPGSCHSSCVSCQYVLWHHRSVQQLFVYCVDKIKLFSLHTNLTCSKLTFFPHKYFTFFHLTSTSCHYKICAFATNLMFTTFHCCCCTEWCSNDDLVSLCEYLNALLYFSNVTDLARFNFNFQLFHGYFRFCVEFKFALMLSQQMTQPVRQSNYCVPLHMRKFYYFGLFVCYYHTWFSVQSWISWHGNYGEVNKFS